MNWLDECPEVPPCLLGDICDARTLEEAVHLAVIQLDLIEEGQDGTGDYTPADVKRIRRWIAKAEKVSG